MDAGLLCEQPPSGEEVAVSAEDKNPPFSECDRKCFLTGAADGLPECGDAPPLSNLSVFVFFFTFLPFFPSKFRAASGILCPK